LVGFTAAEETVPGGSFAGRWNGGKWSTLPSPTGQATGVSCVSASWCMAVAGGPLAEPWNGMDWSAQPIPSGIGLSGVSCASRHACTAVGGPNELLPFVRGGILAVRWNGTRWSYQPMPRPATSAKREAGGLTAVSCPSTTACTAVGSYAPTTDRRVPLIERWSSS
jgi:hypothetical protein